MLYWTSITGVKINFFSLVGLLFWLVLKLIQSQQIQVTFTFKNQNVRQTTYRNNLSNGRRRNPERYPESNKQHSNSLDRTLWKRIKWKWHAPHWSFTNLFTFTFKKQNVRQTTYRNNSSNGCVTLNQINNTRIHSRKQLGSCWALTIVRFSHNVTNPRCIRLKKQNGRQNNRPTRSRTQDFKNTKILSV